MEALNQVVEYLEQHDLSYKRGATAVIMAQTSPDDFPIVFTEGKYPGWVFATFSFAYGAADGPSSVEGLRSLRKEAQEKFGRRIEVFCEGRELCIVGRLKSDPQRLREEVDDYVQACREIFDLLCTAIKIGQWKQDWNSLAFGHTVGNA